MFEVIGIGDIVKDGGRTWGMKGPDIIVVKDPIFGELKPAEPKLP